MEHNTTKAGLDFVQRRGALMRLAAAFAIVLAIALAAFGQDAAPRGAAPAGPSGAAGDGSTVAVSEIVARADEVERDLVDMREAVTVDPSTEAVDESLPVLAEEIAARLAETNGLLRASPSLETLRETEMRWNELGERLAGWQRDLTGRAERLEQESARLAELEATWEQTLVAARDAAAPVEIVTRANATLSNIRTARSAVQEIRDSVLALQSKVSERQTEARDALESVRRVREEAVGRLLVKDSPALWSPFMRPDSVTEMASSARAAWTSHVVALSSYFERYGGSFILHCAIFLAFVGALRRARSRVRPWVEKEPSLERAALMFESPVATALVLAILVAGWVYADAPRILPAALGAILLVPTVILLRRLLEPAMLPALVALAALFFLDIIEGLAEGLPLVSRLLLVVESCAALLFLGWTLARRDVRALGGRMMKAAAVATSAVFLVATLANAFGYVTLARLVAGAGLESAFVGVLLYASVRIADGLTMFALRVRPLAALRMVASHRLLVRRRLVSGLRWIAVALWVVVTLDRFSVREPFFAAIGATTSAAVEVGAIRVTLADVLLVVASLWGAFLVSRFLRFVLEEDVYPRAGLDRGIPYAVSTVAHYAILLAGFLFALGAVGVDMTRFTILASAIGVGLGFGLQNIFNNFASGLILLVERPVKVGDVVEVEGQTGDLRRIGLRASVVRTVDGSEVIVPNGSLISEKVVNWTLSDQRRRLEIRVGVAYGTEPERVLALLAEVAASHPDVLDDPAPQVLFDGFGASALEFLLRAWTDRFDRWPLVRSELMVGVNATLGDAEIEIPFPQRELRLRATARDVESEPALGTSR